jgi:hypothetical protein
MDFLKDILNWLLIHKKPSVVCFRPFQVGIIDIDIFALFSYSSTKVNKQAEIAETLHQGLRGTMDSKQN